MQIVTDKNRIFIGVDLFSSAVNLSIPLVVFNLMQR
jgi:hypothetical protein